jgi:hypothetical protein
VQHCSRFYSAEGVLKGGLRHAVVGAILRYSNSVGCRCVIVPLSILLSLYCLLLAVCFSSFLCLPLLGLACNALLLKKAYSAFRAQFYVLLTRLP